MQASDIRDNRSRALEAPLFASSWMALFHQLRGDGSAAGGESAAAEEHGRARESATGT